LAGARTTSLDLSKKYLEWGKENFRLNSLAPEQHDFVAGDAFEWLRRFGKREQRWDVVILDPPTFSTTKQGRAFQAERDYRELARLAAPLVAPGGILFCSTNQRTFTPERFESAVKSAVADVDRRIATEDFETLPFDFRVATGEKPYLKTVWVTLTGA
jgi:23S rRNA (cytosine1962-C5)-methyltransferase